MGINVSERGVSSFTGVEHGHEAPSADLTSKFVGIMRDPELCRELGHYMIDPYHIL